MSSEVLSQDEVDALLQGVDGEEQPAEAAAAPPAGVRPYNLATQERIVRGRMPALELVNERFVRLLRTGLAGFLNKRAEVAIAPQRVIKYSEFIRTLPPPCGLNVVQARPLRGNALVAFDSMLVSVLVDSMFGGEGRFAARIEGRDFTATEQRIVRRALEVVLENYNKAWQPAHPMAFEYARSETHAQFANIATPGEVVVATTFIVEIGAAAGEMHVAIPYATLEPIRDVLYAGARADSAEPDSRWMHMLRRQVQDAEVELTAQLASTEITVAQVLALRRGEVIGMDIRPTLTAGVDGVPILECRYGVLNGKYAIKVERMLASSHDENSPGERHV